MANHEKIWISKLWQKIKDNSLSIAFFLLFVICLIIQTFTGLETQNDMLTAHGKPIMDYWSYLSTGAFIDGLAVNWQAAILQLGSLIIFSSFLYQHGSPHSRDDKKDGEEPKKRYQGYFSWLYRHSLSMSFLLLFVITMVLHIIFGAKETNEINSITGGKLLSVGGYLASARFWFSTLQTWQAEYLTIAVYLVLSVFLRQEKSAESKPVAASDEETGKANK